MSISPNYKKRIQFKDLESFYYVDCSPVEEKWYFLNPDELRLYRERYGLLNDKLELVINDRETREAVKNLLFFYSSYDKNIYSIRKLTPKYLVNYNAVFYYQQNVFINCIIMLISGDDCAMGCYIEGKLVAHKRLHRYIVRGGGGRSQISKDNESGYNSKGSAGTNLRRYNAKEMDSDIRSLLRAWNQHMKQVNVVFYQGAAVHRPAVLSYFKEMDIPIEKLPFESATKTGGIMRAYEELFAVTCHGNHSLFFNDLAENTLFKNKTSMDPAKCSFVSSVKGERRLEKQNYPSLNPEVKQRLHDAIQSDDYEGLMDIKDRATSQDELSQYLSSVHSKLNDQTFLHYAVRDNLPGAVQALLEMGCDPRIKDKTGKVACEIADKNMKEVFINFRLDNPNLYSWTKCHIPEPSDIVDEAVSMKWKDQKDANRRKVKEQRKKKIESKKIVY